VIPALAFALAASAGLSDGFDTSEISILGAARIVPLLPRSVAGITGIPPGLLVLLALFGIILRCAIRDRAKEKHETELAQA